MGFGSHPRSVATLDGLWTALLPEGRSARRAAQDTAPPPSGSGGRRCLFSCSAPTSHAAGTTGDRPYVLCVVTCASDASSARL